MKKCTVDSKKLAKVISERIEELLSQKGTNYAQDMLVLNMELAETILNTKTVTFRKTSK